MPRLLAYNTSRRILAKHGRLSIIGEIEDGQRNVLVRTRSAVASYQAALNEAELSSEHGMQPLTDREIAWLDDQYPLVEAYENEQ